MTTAINPSWNLSRYVRATIVCRDLKVNARTATKTLISEIAANLAGNGHGEIAGYDARTVRAILLDKTLGGSYPVQPPAQYAGK
jgi:hypothetical protein